MPSSSGSSWPKHRTCISYVSCIGRWVLYHEPHSRSLLVIYFCLIFLSASFLIFSISPVLEALPQYSRCCWREMGLSSSVLHSQDTQVFTHCSPFPWERGYCWCQVSALQVLPGRGWEGLGQVPQLYWRHSLYQGLPITRCMGSETPPGSLGFWWWIPQLPLRYFCLWMDG